MPASFDLICFSHLRWDFVTQRPQHLLTRCAAERRVFFIEEPVIDAAGTVASMHVTPRGDGNIMVAVPHLPEGLSDGEVRTHQKSLIARLIAAQKIERYVLWYYTPMALDWVDDLTPLAVVYDCMDELSAFRGAPASLLDREQRLLEQADLVFTGGQSLYEAKRSRHPHVYAFPSSVDVPHFASARRPQPEPDDQAAIPHPRLGFFGVIDERFDISLLAQAAELRPDWHWIILGPVVKIEEAALPHRDNIHYLGGKSYADLPAYLSGWDVALLLFARNESTRFISPTKTPEYLAAGRPVVSTSIRDVVRPYGDQGLVRIADEPGRFIDACEKAMCDDPALRQAQVDAFLSQTSWDMTWRRMSDLLESVVQDKDVATPSSSR